MCRTKRDSFIEGRTPKLEGRTPRETWKAMCRTRRFGCVLGKETTAIRRTYKRETIGRMPRERVELRRLQLSINPRSLTKTNRRGRRLERGATAVRRRHESKQGTKNQHQNRRQNKYEKHESKRNSEYARRLHAVRPVEDKSESKYD